MAVEHPITLLHDTSNLRMSSMGVEYVYGSDVLPAGEYTVAVESGEIRKAANREAAIALLQRTYTMLRLGCPNGEPADCSMPACKLAAEIGVFLERPVIARPIAPAPTNGVD